MSSQGIRLGADIGGTFTDIVLDVQGTLHTTKVLTNYTQPEQAILDGIDVVTKAAGIEPAAIGTVIHGTTLATNALIQRNGAKTALVTTEGFRDVIEIRTENRFEQYDLDITLPTPLVPREDRYVIKGRMDAHGHVLQPLDEDALEALADELAEKGYEAIAIGFIHAYVNPEHEERAREILQKKLSVPISISAEVSPQMREFERFNTVCSNAYVQPIIASYLARLEHRLADLGMTGSVYLIHSGGGLISVETASRFPVRLVESGPAGGAIFAADIANRFDFDKVISYDMGGTTAKICLIDNGEPQTARTFEVGRTYRFNKGSGMPISIPVIEMIEIGAGGGSIASVNSLEQIQVGPESAGSEPGPASYQRGGTRPAITDADLLLGKLDPDNFAGGDIALSVANATQAVDTHVAQKLGMSVNDAAFGICEIVDENMSNAARVHAVENGKAIDEYQMIAFGGAAPLHAARLCEKLGIDQCLVPRSASVGSAVGFLRAPFAYEALSTHVMRVSALDVDAINRIIADLRHTAEQFVRSGTRKDIHFEVIVYMRYVGQGWEIPVPLPDRRFTADDAAMLQDLFRERYASFFGRAIEDLEAEFVTWSVKAQDTQESSTRVALATQGKAITADKQRDVFDAVSGRFRTTADIERESLKPGDQIEGPAVIVEHETSTVVTASFNAVIQDDGSILLVRKELSA